MLAYFSFIYPLSCWRNLNYFQFLGHKQGHYELFVHAFLCTQARVFLRYYTQERILGLYNMQMFHSTGKFKTNLKDLLIVPLTTCKKYHWSISSPNFGIVKFLIICQSSDIKSQFVMVLFYSSIIANYVEQHFIYLWFIHVSSSVKCWFVSFAHFSIGLFFFFLFICRTS